MVIEEINPQEINPQAGSAPFADRDCRLGLPDVLYELVLVQRDPVANRSDPDFPHSEGLMVIGES